MRDFLIFSTVLCVSSASSVILGGEAPFRLYVPSGRFAGPTLKAFLRGLSGSGGFPMLAGGDGYGGRENFSLVGETLGLR